MNEWSGLSAVPRFDPIRHVGDLDDVTTIRILLVLTPPECHRATEPVAVLALLRVVTRQLVQLVTSRFPKPFGELFAFLVDSRGTLCMSAAWLPAHKDILEMICTVFYGV